MDFHRSVEMSLSREEFFRLLPAALGPFETDEDTIRWADEGLGWVIRLVPLPDRRLGSVIVGRLRAEIIVETASQAEAEAFMDRFHRGFLRAGG